MGEAMCGVRLEKVRSASEDDNGEINLLYDRLGIAMCIMWYASHKRRFKDHSLRKPICIKG